ncbi:MAG: ATP synthase subunit C [Synergistaceae bacterium]|nr:ATP synthase subunit C [Synergistaceae bacterium]
MWSLTVLCVSVAALIGTGFLMLRRARVPRNPRAILAAIMVGAFLVLGFSVTTVFAAETEEPAAEARSVNGLGLMGAALSTGLACIGAGIGVAFVGSAALGVVGEKPSLFGTTLIYMGLAEGIAIYGLVISLFILGRI